MSTTKACPVKIILSSRQRVSATAPFLTCKTFSTASRPAKSQTHRWKPESPLLAPARSPTWPTVGLVRSCGHRKLRFETLSVLEADAKQDQDIVRAGEPGLLGGAQAFRPSVKLQRQPSISNESVDGRVRVKIASEAAA